MNFMTDPTQQNPLPVVAGFGVEEMLTELEAIVAEAVVRLAEEEATA